MSFENLQPETLALHGGTYRVDPTTGAVAVPIYQTTSYDLQNTDHADRLFSLEEDGHIYTRVSNPTQDAGAAYRRGGGRCSGACRRLRTGGVGLFCTQPRRHR